MSSDINMSAFLPPGMQTMMTSDYVSAHSMQCSVVFNFMLDLYNHTLFADYRYLITSPNNTVCHSDRFNSSLLMSESRDDFRDDVTTQASDITTDPSLRERSNIVDNDRNQPGQNSGNGHRTSTQSPRLNLTRTTPPSFTETPEPVPESTVAPMVMMKHKLEFMSETRKGKGMRVPCRFRIERMPSSRYINPCSSLQ